MKVTRARREGGRAALFCVLSQSTLERDFWRENCRKQATAASAAAVPWGTCETTARRSRAARRVARMDGGVADGRPGSPKRPDALPARRALQRLNPPNGGRGRAVSRTPARCCMTVPSCGQAAPAPPRALYRARRPAAVCLASWRRDRASQITAQQRFRRQLFAKPASVDCLFLLLMRNFAQDRFRRRPVVAPGAFASRR
jgi:hypothetical protein